ncbi:MAG: metallophosphoesterase family protein [Clostridia bacterium]|nr:metallophosphoesterase family protein [Clostridia bacterium]
MRTLIVSDIHANLPAFQSVLADAGNWDTVLFLGDIANFGPNPSECVDLLRSLDPICIMGNHDYLISGAWGKRNFFDQWSREQLSERQLKWISCFEDRMVMNETILCIHGAYDATYDILPGIPETLVSSAFSKEVSSQIRTVLFGHYHYQVDCKIDGVEYHCIRPVGHHRDKDIRAGYSILEDGVLSHYRVPYDIEKTIYDTEKISCLTEPFKTEWINLLKNAFSESLLDKDIKSMQEFFARKNY